MASSGCTDCGSVSAAQHSALTNQINTAVAKKSLDASKAQGAAVLKLLDKAAQLSKAAGKGDGFDAVA